VYGGLHAMRLDNNVWRSYPLTVNECRAKSSDYHTAMKFETYAATPGLDRIRSAERFAVYRAIHKRLMREDANYRKRFHQYLSSVIVLAVLPGTAWLGSSALGIVASIVLSIIPGVLIVFLAFRQQHHMNQCIGGVLQQQAH